MQLTIEVLPAPLGPIIENSSPSFTPKLTSVSARTPPKRSDTPRTSKACSTHSLRWRLFRIFQAEYPQSIQWRFARSVFCRLPVQRAETSPAEPVTIFNYGGQVPSRLCPGKRYFCIFCAGVPHKPSNFQPFLAHGLVVPEFGRRALEHDAAVAHHVDAVRYPHRDRELLFHQKDRDAAPGDLGDQVADLLNDDGRQSFSRLINHDQFRVTHKRAAHSQHLLLAARQHAGWRVRPRCEVGKHLEHILEPPLAQTPGILDAKHQVLTHRQAREDISMLRNVTQPQMRDAVARQPCDVAALEFDRALRRHLAHDGLDRRGAPDAIATQQADDLAGIDTHIDALQDMALAVVGV